MNHSINNDKSELRKSHSVTPFFVKGDRELFYESKKLDFDSDEISEHFYENVPKKRKSLSELITNLRSKTRELSLKRYAKKLKPKMIEENKNATSDKFLDDDEFQINEMCSYTSCNEENIYENLDFNDTFVEDETELENYSLKSWLHSLPMQVEDYDDDETLMITKNIPSRHKKVSWNSKADVTVNHQEAELDKFKIEILKKCFYAIWKQESENEILSNLYVFLNDIFATYFRKSRVIVNAEVNTCNNKHSHNTIQVCENVDKKKNVQKLETFILSSTLNRLTITYNKSLKFYFALESSQFCGAEISSILKFCRLINGRNSRILGLKSREELRNFTETLKLILEKSCYQKSINETDDVESTSVIEENIYEPIWDCTNCVNSFESIYEPLNFVEDKTVRDDEDWIIDAEFRYLPKHQISIEKETMYKTVQIIHRVKSDEKISQLFENDATSLSSELIQSKESLADFSGLESVIAWKELLRCPFYNVRYFLKRKKHNFIVFFRQQEDEEEFVRNNFQISMCK